MFLFPGAAILDQFSWWANSIRIVGVRSKDKYFDTSRKIFSQAMTMYNMEAFSILFLRSYDQCQFFFNWSNVKVKRLSTYKRISSQGINVKYQSSSTHYSKVISKIKFLKNRLHSKVKATRSKIMLTTRRSYHKEYSCESSKL